MTALPAALYSAQQTRELDRLAIEGGIPGAELMWRAGRAAFDVLCERWPQASRIAVLCGGGNNGGDGYVVAALAQEAGLQPKVYFTHDPQSLKGDALTMAQRCAALNVPMQALSPVPASALTDTALLSEADVWVDGLLGTGLSALLRDDMRALLDALAAMGKPCLALDVPSGLCADTGMPLGAVLPADVTCTFIGVKQGLLTGVGPVHSGDVRFFDLQVPRGVYQQVPAQTQCPAMSDLAGVLPPRRADGHKGNYGHVLVIGGDHGFAGAAIMTAQAAARCGAGKVSLLTRPEHVATAVARQPEIMVRGIDVPVQAQSLIDAATVIAIGPGLGQNDWGRALLLLAAQSGKPMVLDADALNVFASLALSGSPDWVFTPHPGEAARLLGRTTEGIQENRFESLRVLQQRCQGSVLLKGLGTLVRGDDGAQALIRTGNPGMASGGMGDVLTGIIAALQAQGLSGYDAARWGALLHGQAADNVAARHGQRGLLATDLLPELQMLVNPE